MGGFHPAPQGASLELQLFLLELEYSIKSELWLVLVIFALGAMSQFMRCNRDATIAG